MKPAHRLRFAFVIPWFGLDLPGGAETYCRDFALHLNARGDHVEVLTTCARELAGNWNENHHKPGVYREGGLTVRRFAIKKGDHGIFNDLNRRLLHGGSITPQEERLFMRHIINSSDLIRHIRKTRRDYYFFLIPYMFGTTYWGARMADDRAILIPCLHDEPYARLSPVREMFHAARGILFNSEPEARLARRLYGLQNTSQTVLGVGVDQDTSKPAGCPVRPPFVLYVGRKDSGKNTDLLVRYFDIFKREHPGPLKMVFVGSGQIPPGRDCIDIGYVAPGVKRSLIQNATLLCQPSVNESFSKVIMESWLEETPVLVHADCGVTRYHAETSGGGLSFRDYFEFEACLEYILEHPDTARAMAARGKHYVAGHYSWEALLRRFDTWIGELQEEAPVRNWGHSG